MSSAAGPATSALTEDLFLQNLVLFVHSLKSLVIIQKYSFERGIKGLIILPVTNNIQVDSSQSAISAHYTW